MMRTDIAICKNVYATKGNPGSVDLSNSSELDDKFREKPVSLVRNECKL